MLLLLHKFSMQKKKKTTDSFPSFKQLLGGGSGLGFRV